ncbi:MAG: hypothetical protein GY765_12980 [bacterium]|nr:hypothetical protein [bacterium]
MNSRTNFLKIQAWLPGVLVVVLLVMVYFPALDNYLLRDDFEWLNESYGALHNPSVFFKTINNFFRPLVKFSYLVDYVLFKTNPVYYNITTLLFHLLNVFLLYRLVYRLTGSPGMGGATALLFGTSPFYSEITLWSAGRPDSIMLMFFLLLLLWINKAAEGWCVGAGPASETSGDAYVQQSTGTVEVASNTPACGPKSPAKKYRLPKGRELLKYHVPVLLAALGAMGGKETWVLLPFLAFAFLWTARGMSFKNALKSTIVPFVLLVLYLGTFILLPLLSGTAAPTSYADFKISDAVSKFAFLLYRYVGLGDFFTAAVWQYMLLASALAGLGWRLWKTQNRVAMYGGLWMLMGIAISLPIYYAPSRYNYLPLLGFWLMVVAFTAAETQLIVKKLKLKKQLATMATGILVLCLVVYNIVMVQWEIKDYRMQAQPHGEVAEMYEMVKNQLPRTEPVLFVNIGTRKAVTEASGNIKGYKKLLFVRKKGIWQLVFLSPLANFLGDPFVETMERVPDSQIQGILNSQYTGLVFSDAGFYISAGYKSRVRDYYSRFKKLPDRVEIVRFVPRGKQ